MSSARKEPFLRWTFQSSTFNKQKLTDWDEDKDKDENEDEDKDEEEENNEKAE